MEIIRLRDHSCNMCADSMKLTGPRERHGVYRCKHGYRAVWGSAHDSFTTAENLQDEWQARNYARHMQDEWDRKENADNLS